MKINLNIRTRKYPTSTFNTSIFTHIPTGSMNLCLIVWILAEMITLKVTPTDIKIAVGSIKPHLCLGLKKGSIHEANLCFAQWKISALYLELIVIWRH